MAESKSKVPLYDWISKAINFEADSGLPPFPCKLHIVEHARGEPVIYEEMPGQVLQRRPNEFVTQQILVFCNRIAPKGMLMLDARESRNCADFWKGYTPRLKAEIFPVLQKNEAGFTYHRLPWDFEPGESPTWDEMFSRLENADAIMAWIGSLFEPHSDRQQYCWIHGAGGDGKGALNRFLHHVFNGAYKAETVPEKGDKFWASGLLNARIVSFGDCNNYNFPTKGIFKQITGDDPIKIEFKGENAFSAKLICKLLFLSNQRPNISGERSDTRRAIFSEMAPITGPVIPTRVYDQHLWNEGASFLHKCLERYRALCPNHGTIPVHAESISRLVADNEEELEMITLRNFDVEPPLRDVKIPENKRWMVAPSRLHVLLDEMKIFGDRRRAYLEFLSRRFQVAKKKIKVEGHVVLRYLGIRESSNRATNGVFGAIRPIEE